MWKTFSFYFQKLFIAAGDTALHIAVRNGYSEIVELLLKPGHLYSESYSRRGIVQMLPIIRFLLTQGSVMHSTFKLFLRYNYFDIDCPVMVVGTPSGPMQHISATAFCMRWKQYHWLEILARLGSPVTIGNDVELDGDVPEECNDLTKVGTQPAVRLQEGDPQDPQPRHPCRCADAAPV